jgi:formiminotetrahydrofolate cyclodeaminase
MPYTDKRISEFLDALACKDPTPGGGSTAALAGALGAALVSMVCNLTLGKKGYEDVQAPMQDLLARSEALRRELPELLEADTQVYERVMAAYRLPRKSPEDKAARQEAMQVALKEAAEVPLRIAERCAEVVDLALPAAERGNTWAVSAAGGGVLLAEAARHGALMPGYSNLHSIEDAAYVEATKDRIAALTQGKEGIKERGLEVVRAKMAG